MTNFRSSNRKGLNSFVSLLILVVLAAGSIVGVVACGGKKPDVPSPDQQQEGISEKKGADATGSKPHELKVDPKAQFKVDPKAMEQLQASEFKFEKSGFKLRLPTNFTPLLTPKLRAEIEEATFRDRSTPDVKEQDAPFIFIRVSKIPDQYWNTTIKSLSANIDQGAIPQIRQKGINIKMSGPERQMEINGTKFIRQEADSKSKAEKMDRYVIYCGAVKPYLIEARCFCTEENLEKLLPLLEASIWSVHVGEKH